jgi:DNA-binding NtrC family response regulator
VPALRERKEDIPALAHYFLNKYAGENKKFIRGIEQTAMEALTVYEWPGNIRELENIIERAVVLSRLDIIVLEDLPRKMQNNYSESRGENKPAEDPHLAGLIGMPLAELERIAVLKALKAEKWNQTRAAARLCITRRQLRTKMEKYQLL